MYVIKGSTLVILNLIAWATGLDRQVDKWLDRYMYVIKGSPIVILTLIAWARVRQIDKCVYPCNHCDTNTQCEWLTKQNLQNMNI